MYPSIHRSTPHYILSSAHTLLLDPSLYSQLSHTLSLGPYKCTLSAHTNTLFCQILHYIVYQYTIMISSHQPYSIPLSAHTIHYCYALQYIVYIISSCFIHYCQTLHYTAIHYHQVNPSLQHTLSIHTLSTAHTNHIV